MVGRLSFQNKIFLSYSAFIIAILIVLAAFFYVYISNILRENAIKRMEQTAVSISSNLDSIIREMDTISTQVLYSEEIQNIMYDAFKQTQKDINYFENHIDISIKTSKILTAINSPKTIVRRIGLFNNTNNYISIDSFKTDVTIYHKKPEIIIKADKIIEPPLRRVILPPHADDWIEADKVDHVFSLIRELKATYNVFDSIGYIEIQQPYTLLEQVCSSGSNDLKVHVYAQNGDLIYPLDDLSSSYHENYHELVVKYNNTEGRQYNLQEELVFIKHSTYTNWTVVLANTKESLMAPVYFLRNVIIIIGFLLSATTVLIMYIITKSLTSPIRKMRKLVKNISLENLSIQLSNQSGNNEITLLSEAFEKTLIRLKESVEQIIQAKAGKAHAHMLALQAQINPHFIYNSLMCISAAGQEAGSRKVMHMCSQLSSMLRYTASFDQQDTRLFNELDHVENYLSLMKWRYENWLTYTIEVDNNMKNIKVPKLILQPLIENCFSHAFKDILPPFNLLINGYCDGNLWYLKILDNGKGFDQESISSLTSRIQQYKEDIANGQLFNKMEIGGMGILNIFLRLSLFYGNDAVFETTNRPEGGAEVIVGGIMEVE